MGTCGAACCQTISVGNETIENNVLGVLPAARNSNTTVLLVGCARHQSNAPMAYGHDFLIIQLIGNATWEQYPGPLNSNEGCLVCKLMLLSFNT